MSKNVNELRKFRENFGFTQIEMANILNISRRTYQKYEEGTNKESLTVSYEELLDSVKKYASHFDESHGLLSIKKIKAIANEIFNKNGKVVCAYLFGSYSRNEATEKSDVDILIYAPELHGFEFVALLGELKDAFHKEVDLVSLSQISDNIPFMSEILTKGVKLWPSTR